MSRAACTTHPGPHACPRRPAPRHSTCPDPMPPLAAAPLPNAPSLGRLAGRQGASAGRPAHCGGTPGRGAVPVSGARCAPCGLAEAAGLGGARGRGRRCAPHGRRHKGRGPARCCTHAIQSTQRVLISLDAFLFPARWGNERLASTGSNATWPGVLLGRPTDRWMDAMVSDVRSALALWRAALNSSKAKSIPGAEVSQGPGCCASHRNSQWSAGQAWLCAAMHVLAGAECCNGALSPLQLMASSLYPLPATLYPVTSN